MSYTFEVNDVYQNTDPIDDKDTISIQEQIIQKIGADVEQVCLLPTPLIKYATPNIVGLAHQAFSDHLHMLLDPDDVWITIEHGLATHIKENSEDLRSQFVNFDGKILIELRRDEFVRGCLNNWEGCFDEFSEKIGGYIGANKELIVSDFSTTGKLQRVSSEIVLMDAMSKYFDYSISTRCGIPIITLGGNVEDWEKIRDRAGSFDGFGLSWWTQHLNPVLDQLVETAKGNPDINFWRSWYKEDGGSGGPFVTGHINTLFPYINEKPRRNNEMGKNNAYDHGNSLDAFQMSISRVPFVWDYFSIKYPMEFVGGIVGLAQEKGIVKCEFGWAVRDQSVPLSNFPIEKMVKYMIIYHKDGDKGKLIRAEGEQFGNEARTLYEVQIEWEKKGLQKHTGSWKFNEMFVKEAVIGESIQNESK
jgi:hypothetical protein